MEQFSLPLNDPIKKETPLTKEEILQWTDEERDAMYQELIGKKPTADLSPEQIAKGILNPEQENIEIIQRSLEEDRGEVTRTYRR